ncbi:uncharacterized protein LOC119173623 isoform X2 [Rhipicephalus microplus]|uniref:uncharacterized protein LOC119173623 isoform X2 n=1 Tax=Rhipicephalus microplus TaxID=6941 RepID=UPI003F6A8AC1
MATKTLEERRKAYFAYVRYVQSIAVLRQSKAKARNAKKEKEAMIQKFIEMVRDTLKQAKEQIWRRACFKKLIAHKDDLENMQGGIEHVAVSLEEQNKKVAEAGYVAIKTVKPIDKETLYLQLSALVKQSENPNKLYCDQAWMKLIPALYRLLQDLKRTAIPKWLPFEAAMRRYPRMHTSEMLAPVSQLAMYIGEFWCTPHSGRHERVNVISV